MKTNRLAAVSATILAACIIAPTPSAAQGNSGNSGNSGNAALATPINPVGTLSAYPTVVRAGTYPTLTWDIVYPSVVSNVAQIIPPGTIQITKNNTYVSVKPIGTGITACDATQGATPLNAEARMSLNGGAYSQLFYGVQSNVSPAYSLYIKKLGTGAKIDFSGRYVKNGAWSPMYTTLSSNLQVVALVNGDTPPTTFPLYQSSLLASYLRPYLSSTGKINIGPLSVIIMMELGQTDHSKPCFDYQDMVLLVTLSSGHPNNGHGNNLDGVDSSNPGQGGGGPNGAVDPSGGVDDERR